MREVVAATPRIAVLTVSSLILVALAARVVPENLGGSLTYAPALVALFGFGVYHYRTQQQERWTLLAAAAAFLLSLSFRTVDADVCDAVPIGTHFMWHVLNAVVMYLLFRGLVSARRSGDSKQALAALALD